MEHSLYVSHNSLNSKESTTKHMYILNVHTPQKKKRAERRHMYILNVSRALRFQTNLTIEFRGECVLIAGHLINRSPSPLLKNKTPFEMIHD